MRFEDVKMVLVEPGWRHFGVLEVDVLKDTGTGVNLIHIFLFFQLTYDSQ